jgi:hypothetical protein
MKISRIRTLPIERLGRASAPLSADETHRSWKASPVGRAGQPPALCEPWLS